MHLHHYKVALYITGGVLEAAGIVLLWAPDVGPYITAGRRAAARNLNAARARFAGHIRRLIGRPRVITASASATVYATASAWGQVLRGVPERTLAEQVRDLIAHDRIAQERLNLLERRADEEAAARTREIDAQREELVGEIVHAVEAAEIRGRRQRAIGTGLVGLGALIGTLGNLA